MWIDLDLCTGYGLCVERSPDVFTLLEDGIAYVVEGGLSSMIREGRAALHLWKSEELAVIEAAEICPGECIFIEMDDKNLSPIGSASQTGYSHSSR